MIPGPAGLIMAVVLSGLPLHAFTFRGFAPRKPGPRKRFLGIDARSPHTLIFYESPYRLEALLKDALEVYGDRRAAIANDLTKKFETVDRGTISELLAGLKKKAARGEYIVVIEGVEKGTGSSIDKEDDEDDEDDVDGDEREDTADYADADGTEYDNE
jgi:16S rRNA (cytidine1402-2'-O)-methyltransferase